MSLPTSNEGGRTSGADTAVGLAPLGDRLTRLVGRLALTRRQVRLGLGLLWLLDAGLQAQPRLFGAGWWRDDLAQSVMAEPSPVSHSILVAVGVVAAHPVPWNALFVTVEVLLGLALVSGRLERAAIVASVPWAIGVWWVGEGFGMLPTGFAALAGGSPGAAVLYPLIGLLAWPRPQLTASEGQASISRAGGAGLWLLLWAGQALEHVAWVYPSGQALTANVEERSLGQLHWQLVVAHHVEAMIGAHPLAVSVALAIVEVTIGASVLSRRTQRVGLTIGIVVSLVYWVAVQYFGGVLGGGATDPGAAPLVALLALALWRAPPPFRTPLPPRHSDRENRGTGFPVAAVRSFSVFVAPAESAIAGPTAAAACARICAAAQLLGGLATGTPHTLCGVLTSTDRSACYVRPAPP